MATDDRDPNLDPRPVVFPPLTIVTVDAPKLTQREKYGGLFYLGAGGLAVVIGLVGWFGWSAWSLRSIWWNVYVLHDPSRPEDERIQAAYGLSRDIRVNAQQRWDIALRKPLPPLARYLIAESLTTDAVKADPEHFAKIVALSEGWPDWLRVLGVRVMALAAAEGLNYSTLILDDLTEHNDRVTGDWVDYIRAVSGEGDRSAAARLRNGATEGEPLAALDRELSAAVEAGAFERKTHLDGATAWLRAHHPQVSKLWIGWTERDGRLVKTRP